MSVDRHGIMVRVMQKHYTDVSNLLERILHRETYECAVSVVQRDGTVFHVGLSRLACDRIVVGNDYVLRGDGSLYSQRSGRVYA